MVLPEIVLAYLPVVISQVGDESSVEGLEDREGTERLLGADCPKDKKPEERQQALAKEGGEKEGGEKESK